MPEGGEQGTAQGALHPLVLHGAGAGQEIEVGRAPVPARALQAGGGAVAGLQGKGEAGRLHAEVPAHCGALRGLRPQAEQRIFPLAEHGQERLAPHSGRKSHAELLAPRVAEDEAARPAVDKEAHAAQAGVVEIAESCSHNPETKIQIFRKSLAHQAGKFAVFSLFRRRAAPPAAPRAAKSAAAFAEKMQHFQRKAQALFSKSRGAFRGEMRHSCEKKGAKGGKDWERWTIFAG